MSIRGITKLFYASFVQFIQSHLNITLNSFFFCHCLQTAQIRLKRPLDRKHALALLSDFVCIHIRQRLRIDPFCLISIHLFSTNDYQFVAQHTFIANWILLWMNYLAHELRLVSHTIYSLMLQFILIPAGVSVENRKAKISTTESLLDDLKCHHS